MVIPAKPVWGAMAYTDPKTGQLSAGGQQALAQWHGAINSIPISVSGEQVAGKGTQWKLKNVPAASVMLFGQTAGGLVPLAKGKGSLHSYSIDGAEITTEQNFQGVIACYEYLQG